MSERNRSNDRSERINLRLPHEKFAALRLIAERLGLDVTALVNLMVSRTLPGFQEEAAAVEASMQRLKEIVA